jgi:cell division topological specificity factor
MFYLKEIRRRVLKKTAADAKERLQIIIAHERRLPCRTIDLPSLQTDLLNIVRKYVVIKDEDITIRLEKKGRYEILELNIILPNMENQQFG